ncbi:BRO family protein [Lactobacillus taiwanensis]|uniref:BRO family protein n=1 Tax=Lactobacillus taiwanensis TaxID=508451 RepID=UPI00242CE079|nr:BRO family protein [Lactobacillus taiwanensis]
MGKDIATILGYKQAAKAVREHVDDEDKGVSILDTLGGKQQVHIEQHQEKEKTQKNINELI